MDFAIDIDPNDIGAELSKDVIRAGEDVVRELTELVPLEMRQSFGTSPSPRGSAPGIKSGNLSRSLKGTANGLNGEIGLAYYAEFLDPFFGGKLDRPFVEKAFDEAVVRVAGNL